MGNASASRRDAREGRNDDNPGSGTVVGKAFVVLTTEQIRELCADDGGLAEYHDPINGHHEADRAREMFDRWLAAHDAEVAAKAQREVLTDLLRNPTWHRGMYGAPDDMYSARAIRALIAAEATPEGGQDA